MKARRKLLRGGQIGVVAFLAGQALAFSGLLDDLEEVAWDRRVAVWARPAETTPQVRLVLLDQASLDWAEENWGMSWPWYREAYEPMLAFLRRSSHKAVAFDWIYSEPSGMGEPDDVVFAKAIAATPAFVGSVGINSTSGLTEWPADVKPPREAQGVQGWPAEVGTRKFGNFNVSGISQASAVLGNVQVHSNSHRDATVRRLAPFSIFDDKFVPSLALGALMAAEPEAAVRFEGRSLYVGEHRLPLDRDGNVILAFRGGLGVYPAITAASLLRSELQLREGHKPSVDPSFFDDAYVFFGPSAPGLMDLVPTPLEGSSPGVVMHATLLDNLLANDLIADVPRWLSGIWMAIVALVGGILPLFARNGLQSLAIIGGVAATPAVLGFLAYPLGYWFPIASLFMAAAMALFASLSLAYATEGRQRRFIKGAFNQYLSPVVIEKLISDPGSLRLGGERRELSLYFSDIQGFTSFSEELDPERLTALLNAYLSAMTDIVLEEGGTIDKYQGDAVIAFWNAPLDVPDHAERAVRAAVRCQEKLAELRPGFRAQYGHDLYARIGLNTGAVIVGNMGSQQRFDYTFLGDAGNLAARLEGVNKVFGTFMMISEATMVLAGDAFAYRELSTITVVGRAEPIRVFEPMSHAHYAANAERLKTFALGLAAWSEGRFEEAAGHFAEIADEDPPAGRYLAQCRELAAAPPEDWDGVWRMTHK